MFRTLVGVLCVSAFSMALGGKKQKVSVRGRIVCPSDPTQASNVRIKLVDEDTGPNPDDTMARERTDENGNFRMEGEESEWTTIDPYLKIYHDCNDGAKPCQRKWRIGIPDRYIDSGEDFDIGVLNLEMKLNGESRDCIHK